MALLVNGINRASKAYYQGKQIEAIFIGRQKLFPFCTKTAEQQINDIITTDEIQGSNGDIPYEEININMMRRANSTPEHDEQQIEFSPEIKEEWTNLMRRLLQD